MLDDAPDTTRWVRRMLFRGALACWFSALAFWFGPNVILFHKLTRPSPDDFVPVVEKYCVPAVRAIKLYQRDHGQMPPSIDALGPPFSSHRSDGPGYHMIDAVRPYTYTAFGSFHHTIYYDFTPGHEGWTIHGAFANGPIPVPPVTLEPVPTTSP
jgi:hypothetical protein